MRLRLRLRDVLVIFSATVYVFFFFFRFLMSLGVGGRQPGSLCDGSKVGRRNGCLNRYGRRQIDFILVLMVYGKSGG